MVCVHCGEKIGDNSPFCNNCGAEVAAPVADVPVPLAPVNHPPQEQSVTNPFEQSSASPAITTPAPAPSPTFSISSPSIASTSTRGIPVWAVVLICLAAVMAVVIIFLVNGSKQDKPVSTATPAVGPAQSAPSTNVTQSEPTQPVTTPSSSSGQDKPTPATPSSSTQPAAGQSKRPDNSPPAEESEMSLKVAARDDTPYGSVVRLEYSAAADQVEISIPPEASSSLTLNKSKGAFYVIVSRKQPIEATADNDNASSQSVVLMPDTSIDKDLGCDTEGPPLRDSLDIFFYAFDEIDFQSASVEDSSPLKAWIAIQLGKADKNTLGLYRNIPYAAGGLQFKDSLTNEFSGKDWFHPGRALDSTTIWNALNDQGKRNVTYLKTLESQAK